MESADPAKIYFSTLKKRIKTERKEDSFFGCYDSIGKVT
jgi:hypothetical protein